MSWWSDGEPFDEYDYPWCENCKGGNSKAECDRCYKMHTAVDEEEEPEEELAELPPLLTEKGEPMSDIRLYRVMRDLEGKHCGNEYLGNLVTCGECKNWFEYDGVNFCYRTRCTAKADDFCSRGERKESE